MFRAAENRLTSAESAAVVARLHFNRHRVSICNANSVSIPPKFLQFSRFHHKVARIWRFRYDTDNTYLPYPLQLQCLFCCSSLYLCGVLQHSSTPGSLVSRDVADQCVQNVFIRRSAALSGQSGRSSQRRELSQQIVKPGEQRRTTHRRVATTPTYERTCSKCSSRIGLRGAQPLPISRSISRTRPARQDTSIFFMPLPRCFSTVLMLIPSWMPIDLLVAPS